MQMKVKMKKRRSRPENGRKVKSPRPFCRLKIK
jgi:hypothetical protein